MTLKSGATLAQSIARFALPFALGNGRKPDGVMPFGGNHGGSESMNVAKSLSRTSLVIVMATTSPTVGQVWTQEQPTAIPQPSSARMTAVPAPPPPIAVEVVAPPEARNEPVPPTAEQRVRMLHCFARAANEEPWREIETGALTRSEEFASQLSLRCDPETDALNSQVLALVPARSSDGKFRSSRERLAEGRPRLILELLPEALALRENPPSMTPDEIALDATRYLVGAEERDFPGSRLEKVLTPSIECLDDDTIVPKEPVGSGCGLVDAILNIEAELTQRYPEADPKMISRLAGAFTFMGVILSAVTRRSDDEPVRIVPSILPR